MGEYRHPGLPKPAPSKRPPRALSEAEKLKQKPWYPRDYALADVMAVKALAMGTASADQQRRAISYIIEKLCGTYDMSYRPGGDDGRRDTDFAEGQRFVGNQIVKFVNMNVADLQRMESADAHEPSS
jgi:hypothetical protein